MRNGVYIWKPGGGYGGYGITMTRSIHDLLRSVRVNRFQRLKEQQCYGLTGLEGVRTENECERACFDQQWGSPPEQEVFVCGVWNWRRDDGCWVGSDLEEGVDLASGQRQCSPEGSAPEWAGGRIRPSEPSIVQFYVPNPVLGSVSVVRPEPGGDIVRKETVVKTDIRVQGFAHLDPLRVYVSKHGYYRSGSPSFNFSTSDHDLARKKLMHITHHIPKIESGDWEAGQSGGSLAHWLHWAVREQTGLDPDRVWKNVKKAIGIFVLGARFEICDEEGMLQQNLGGVEAEAVVGGGWSGEEGENRTSAGRNANGGDSRGSGTTTTSSSRGEEGGPRRAEEEEEEGPRPCASHGFHFIADLVVDSLGRAWLMEMHFTLGVKAPGLGDPEAGYDEVLTRETRQGVFGAVSMAFARNMDLRYRRGLDRVITAGAIGTLTSSSGGGQADLLRRSKPEETVKDMLVEDRMLCRFDMESVLPKMWRDFVSPGLAKHSVKNLVSGELAEWYERWERGLEKAEEGRVGVDRAKCDVVDFNKDRVWQSVHVDYF